MSTDPFSWFLVVYGAIRLASDVYDLVTIARELYHERKR